LKKVHQKRRGKIKWRRATWGSETKPTNPEGKSPQRRGNRDRKSKMETREESQR